MKRHVGNTYVKDGKRWVLVQIGGGEQPDHMVLKGSLAHDLAWNEIRSKLKRAGMKPA